MALTVWGGGIEGIINFANKKLQGICNDPFDPNFDKRFVPEFVSLPEIPNDPSFPEGFVHTANSMILHEMRAAVFLHALNVSLDRWMSALQLHDDASARLQTRAVEHFLGASAKELDEAGEDALTLATIIQGTSLDQAVTLDQIKAFLQDLQTRGADALPPGEVDLLKQLGADPAAVVASLLLVDPTDVPQSASAMLRDIASSDKDLARLMSGRRSEGPRIPVPASLIPALALAVRTKGGR